MILRQTGHILCVEVGFKLLSERNNRGGTHKLHQEEQSEQSEIDFSHPSLREKKNQI